MSEKFPWSEVPTPPAPAPETLEQVRHDGFLAGRNGLAPTVPAIYASFGETWRAAWKQGVEKREKPSPWSLA